MLDGIREPGVVLEEVRAAVGSGAAVSGLALELTLSLCGGSRFPADAFERLVALLGDVAFRAHAGAWEFVKGRRGRWCPMGSNTW
ncbi:hypothetical protein HPC49_05445 [Pyxidicoccus fallax]|uniref:Uncharacterized protein n=1 Tax=Pyxidicoccus fallax TaxID=394095 RepID=A0A848L842_9BACT|nr:hypothetical protein [Pyxidicoccus fallax]NMO14737.1 hypothetical protein [Pyxidicoccus fallax]NPC77698.1 hypothetical protein [Pyxidicoccus fallax]